MRTATQYNDLFNRRLILRNTLLNLGAQIIPILIALLSIPIIIKGLGTDKFGILAIFWMLIGYYGIFDFGLSRALTKITAEKLGTDEEPTIPALFWTAFALLLSFGVLGAILIALCTSWFVNHFLTIPEYLQRETINSFYILAASLPFVISAAGMVGMLEAKQRFDLTSIIRVITGILNFLGPLMALTLSDSICFVVIFLAISRLISWIAYLVTCIHAIPALRQIMFDRRFIKPLACFGGWIGLSNIINPFLNGMDRFLIASMLSMTAVAYYATPYEIIAKVSIIPAAFVGVLFPVFSSSYVQDKKHTVNIFAKAMKILFLIMFPIILSLMVFAKEGIFIWLGKDFMLNSTRVMQMLSIGAFVNGLSYVPHSLIQGIGRPDLTTKYHIVELITYPVVLIYCITYYGIFGAAAAYVFRVSLDMVLLFWTAVRIMKLDKAFIRNMLTSFAISNLTFCILMFDLSIVIRIIYMVSVLFSFYVIAWSSIISNAERSLLKSYVNRLLLISMKISYRV